MFSPDGAAKALIGCAMGLDEERFGVKKTFFPCQENNLSQIRRARKQGRRPRFGKIGRRQTMNALEAHSAFAFLQRSGGRRGFRFAEMESASPREMMSQ
jgi:hypothetical protein